MLYCAGCLTVTDLLPYLYLDNVLLRGINSLLSRTTLLLSVCFAGIHTVLYDFQALIPILQVHLSKTINYMTDIICIGPIHANLSPLQVWIFYITQWETKRNSIWFSHGVSSQGCVVSYILQPFALTLGRIFEVYIKRKNVLPVVFQENKAGTHRPCAILNSYQWTELPFKMSVKSQLFSLLL